MATFLLMKFLASNFPWRLKDKNLQTKNKNFAASLACLLQKFRQHFALGDYGRFGTQKQTQAFEERCNLGHLAHKVACTGWPSLWIKKADFAALNTV